MLLKDKVAVVTGSGRGIGRGIAVALAREGAKVIVNDVGCEVDGRGTADDPAMQVVNEIKKLGSDAAPNYDSVSEFDSAERIIRSAVDTFGRIDILVNNAAWQDCGDRIEEMTTEEWRRIFATNIEAMFHLSKAAIPRMREGGTIVNTASIQAYSPSPELLPYSATKGAIITFTKGLAQDPGVLERGLRVNAVAPGPIWTPLIPSTMPAEKAAKFGENTPLGRAGQPAELAPIYVFLASQESSYITGEVVGVTGGRPLG